MLNTATDDEVIVRNPCRIKGAGVEATPERPVITLAQVLALAAAMPPRYRALVLLAVFASMRWGELIGLRRVDLDLESASVSIERSAVEVGKRIVIKTPKTSAGIRSVALAGVAGARAVAPPRHLRRGRAGWVTRACDGRAGPGYRGSAGRDAAGGGVSAILGTFWARGPQAGAVRLGGPRNKLDLTDMT